MSWVEVSPAVASGTLDAPPSKSYTHRALVAGHLTGRSYRVEGPLDAEDTRATARGLANLGTRAHWSADHWQLRPARVPARPVIRCGASGTTLRLLTSVAGLTGSTVRFTGTARLGQRPLEPLLGALRSAGAEVRHPLSSTLPLTLTGPLRSGEFRIDGSESSQFVSSLLFALPRLDGPSTLQVTGESVSAPYISATLAVLRSHGIHVSGRPGRWNVPGDQAYRGTRFRVPGDASSAAYLWAAAAVSGGTVSVRGIPDEWPQADAAVLPLLRSAGARVQRRGDAVTVSGPISRPFDVELTPCPDLYPLAGALAAVLPGESHLRGAPHIVGKESDRRAATIDLVRRLGGRSRLGRGELRVTGTRRPTAVRGALWDDHRLVMSAAVASLASGSTARLGAREAVRKSYPGFWDDLTALGVPVRRSR